MKHITTSESKCDLIDTTQEYLFGQNIEKREGQSGCSKNIQAIVTHLYG